MIEGVGGTRVSETTGDLFGLLANNMAIVIAPWCTDPWNREVVEIRLEDAKTGNPRFINLPGMTVGSGLRVSCNPDCLAY